MKRKRRKRDSLSLVDPPAATEDTSLPIGHPRRWLALAGLLTPEEGAFIRQTVRDFDRLEPTVPQTVKE